MKITICNKQVMAMELLLQVIRSLYENKPPAKLLHADVDVEEKPYDSSNERLNFKGKFTVAVTDAVKVELGLFASFIKSTNPHVDKHFRTWKLTICHVTEPESGEQLDMIMHEGVPKVWNHQGKRGEFLSLILAN